MSPRSIAHFSPARLIFSAILIALIFGTALLKLPFCHTQHISWLDALFTAASCLCTCGLSTIPTTGFTVWGQCILLLLIQIGGLGMVTVFFISFFFNAAFSTQVIAGQALDLGSFKYVKKIIFFKHACYHTYNYTHDQCKTCHKYSIIHQSRYFFSYKLHIYHILILLFYYF